MQSFPAGAPGDKTSDWDIQQVIAIVAALLAENDQATCLAFVNGLPPPVLADVVLVSMAHLPRREEVFKSEPHAAGPESQKSGNTLLAGLMQATAQPEGAPPLPQPNPAVFHQVMQQAAARQPSEPAAAPGVTQQQALPKENKAASATAYPPTTTGPPPFATPPEKQEVSAASSRRLPAAKAASPAAIKLQPLQLTRQQLAEGRRAALRRILHASARPCQQLRSNILAHFAPNLQDDSWAEAMAAEMVDRKEAGGYELALKWLCAIFAATSEPPPAAAAEPSGVADDERRESGQAVCSSQHVETSPAYNRCLQSLLHVCRDRLPAKDRTLIQLLVDAPALPDAVLQELLVSLLSRGDDYATLALIGARDVVLLRPRHRQQGLNAMLQMAVSPDTDVRAKAVRLIANKLFPNILLTAEIQRFAAAQLQKLCQQPQQNGKRRREEAAAPEEEVPKRQRQMAEERPGGDGSQAEVNDGVHGDGPKLNGVPKAGVEGGERQAETASPGRGAEKRKASEQSPEHSSAERQNAAAPSDTASPEDSAEPAEPEESPEVAARHCELFCALCTKRHALLRELFVMFGRARPPGRAAVLRNAEGLARVLGLSAPALLALIEDVPAGSEALLLKMLYFLTEEQPPPQVLAEACFRNFERTRDPSFLPPALPGMPKERIIPFLPKLLDPVSLFSVALARIFLPLPSGEASMTPTELLLALHSIDPSQEGIRLKQVMGALDLCLTLRDTFNKAVLASTLQQLNQRSVLPPLYMRFLMQSQAAVPELKSFTIEQLAALVNRQIWTNKTLFTGWNLAVRQNVPESFPAFLQLPSRVLSETLQAAPPDFQQKLKEYAESPACPANQQKPIYRLLESIRKTE